MIDFQDTFETFLMDFLAFLPELITALVIFIISIYLAGVLARIVQRALQRREADPEMSLLVTKITRWAIVILGLVISLEQIGFDLSAFLAGLGILGFTLGFALQDVSKNFVAGMLLLVQQPFDIGDDIEVSGYGGTVLDVDLRATEIRTFDGKHVLVPNGEVLTSAIINFTRASKRRIKLDVGVAYGSDLEQVTKTALEAVAGIPGVLSDPSPQVVFNNFGASSVDFALFYWIDVANNGVNPATDAGVKAVHDAFEAKGIEIPYPVQTVYLQQ